MKLWSFVTLLSVPLFFTTTATAAYRCEQHGQITYTDHPCERADGITEREISAPRHRPAPPRAGRNADRAGANDQADVNASRERAEVARLQGLREQRERQDRQIRDLASRGAAARERKCRSLALQMKWREEDLREAPLDKAPKARTRLRRTAEKYQAECR